MLAAGRIHPVNGSRYRALKFVMRLESIKFRLVGPSDMVEAAGILPRGNDSITIAAVQVIHSNNVGGDTSL